MGHHHSLASPSFLLVPSSLLVLSDSHAVLLPCLFGFDYIELAHNDGNDYAGGKQGVGNAMTRADRSSNFPVNNACIEG